jgi:hypothetical protein
MYNIIIMYHLELTPKSFELNPLINGIIKKNIFRHWRLLRYLIYCLPKSDNKKLKKKIKRQPNIMSIIQSLPGPKEIVEILSLNLKLDKFV